ncbi:ABC transporter permease [Isoptericola sp. BMS4]|uniref:ABC transporter permease n=1 Tax=Isoptericola sp. BMS4 TaxID=2527875 RepID=UPI00141DA10F|nr:ABC transporter permease [Isoptericola sp. BMS4]
MTARSPRGTGLGAVLRLQLRTGWVVLLAWVLGLVATYAATVSAIDTTYGTPEQLASYQATVGSDPTMAAINGTPYGADTLGGVVANEFGFIAAIAVPLMGLLLVVRGTRAAEETGLLELLRSRAVGSRTPWVAALLLTATALLLVGLGMAAALVAEGVATADAALYAASVVGLGLVFAGVATLAGQLLRRAAGVVGAGVVVLGAAYLFRAVGDVKDNGWRWLSPLAWQQETRPFAEDARVWPLLLALGAAAVLVTSGLALVGRRDLGSAVVPSRPGPARAGAVLTSTLGLALRQHGPALAGWALGAALVGAVFGAFTDDVADVVAANPDLQAVFSAGAQGDPTSWYASFTLVLLVLMALGAGAQVVGRVRAEETAGRLEAALARTTSRVRWLGAHILVAVVGGAVVALAGGAALAGVVARVTGDDGGTLASAVDYLPAVAVVPAFGVALVGLAPRATAVQWAALGYVAVVEMLGETLDLPDALLQASPMHAIGRLPAEPASGTGVLVVLAVAVALVGLGLAGFRRRDVPR